MPIVNFLSGLHQLALLGESEFASQMLQRAGTPWRESRALVSRAESLSSRLLNFCRESGTQHTTALADPQFLISSRDSWFHNKDSAVEQVNQLLRLGVSADTCRILRRFCKDINYIKYGEHDDYPIHFVAGDYVTGFLEDGAPRTMTFPGNLFVSGVLRMSEYVFLSRAFALPVPSLGVATGERRSDDGYVRGLDLHSIDRFISLVSLLDGRKDGVFHRLRLPTLSEISAFYFLLGSIEVGRFLDGNFNDAQRECVLDGRHWLKPGQFANAVVDYRSPPIQDLKEVAQAAAKGHHVAVSRVRERAEPAHDGTPILSVSDRGRSYRYHSGNVPKGMRAPCLYSPRTGATERWRHDAEFNVRLVASFPDAGLPPQAPKREWKAILQDLNRRLVECADLPRALERLIPFMDADEKPIRYLGDLVQMTSEDLLRYPGLGPKGLKDVRRFLEKKGLCLQMTGTGWTPPPDSPSIVN